jgi:hypothetical protein
MFDVDAKGYDKSIKRSLGILLPLLDIEHITLGSNERFNEAMAKMILKVRSGIVNGQKVERSIVQWFREKRKKT